MPKYIKKKDLKNAIDECTWYHIGKNGELVEGANSSEHEPLYKYSDIKEIIKNLPTRKFENEPKRTALSKALKWTYGDEPNSSEKPNNCKDEPQTVVRLKHFKCPKCGRSDYIRSFEDWGIDGGIYKYKCINCNTYIKDEPQTEEWYAYQDEQEYRDRWDAEPQTERSE